MDRANWILAARGPHALPGLIAGFALPSVLVQLMRKKASGKLTLKVGEIEREISLMQGVVSSVQTTYAPEKMVARRKYRRMFTKAQHASIQEVMHKDHVRFGAALIQLKLVDSEAFSKMLAEHHAFLVGQCLRAEALHCSFDEKAKSPADRAPLQFLTTVEQAVAALPVWRRWSLDTAVRLLVLTAQKEDVALAQRLTPGPEAERILTSASAAGATSSALIAQAGGRRARASMEALFLCGLLKPTEESLARRRSSVPRYAFAAAVGACLGIAATLLVAARSVAPVAATPASAPVADVVVEAKVSAPSPASAPVVETAITQQLNPKCAPLLASGEKALRAGKTARALDDLSRAQKCAPTSPEVQRAYAVAWQQKGKPKKATEAYKRYLQLAPDAPDRDVISLLIGPD